MNSHRKLIRSHGQERMNLGELLPELHPTLTSRCEFHCHQSPSRETRREDREAGHKYTSAVAQCETLYWCSSEFDSTVSISTRHAACAIDLHFFKPYQISLRNTLIVVIKYIWRRQGWIQGCRAAHTLEGARPKKRHTGYIPGHFLLSKAVGNHVALS